MAALEDDLRDDPEDALPELDRLVERMLVGSGYDVADPVARAGEDREVVAEFLAAREISQLVEQGENDDPGNVAAAINGYRAVYDFLIENRSSFDEA